MAIRYWIEVRFRTEGECCYRKEESAIPRIPDWSRCCEKIGESERWYIKEPAKLPYKKRWLLPNLYYKSYCVEYWSFRHVELGQWNTPPTNEYWEWITNIIKPLPNEHLIERCLAKEREAPYVFHVMFYHYKFVETNGKLQAVLEKQEEEHYYNKTVNHKIEKVLIVKNQ